MANQSLGFVTVAAAGTPARLTANETTPSAQFGAHSYLVEVHPNNTGNVYIGTATMNKATGVGVFAILPPPTANTYPSFSSNIVEAAAGFALNNIYIDVDNNGEAALISCIIA